MEFGDQGGLLVLFFCFFNYYLPILLYNSSSIGVVTFVEK